MSNRVLIIEDDKTIAEFFRAVLTLAGMEAEMVHTAREGLVKISSSTPNLVLLDMNLGSSLGGEDILYQIRSNPRFDGSFVIVVTGYPNLTSTVDELADMILIKPIDMEQLTTLARRLLSHDIAPRSVNFRDPVTSLYTLEFFHTRLELAFERGKRRPEFLYGVVALRLDVLDEDGQIVTPDLDTSLLLWGNIAHRLRKNVRPTDSVARAGEWYFLVLSEDLRKIDDITIIMDRLVNSLSEPFLVNERQFTLKVNCGFATQGEQFHQPGDVLEAAENQLTGEKAGQAPPPGQNDRDLPDKKLPS
jgi:PleD family two-component response regulator